MSPQPQPFDDRDGFIWMNGKLVPWRDAQAHVLTHALHYGSSVFEGERSYGGHVFKLQEHTERLFASAQILDIKIPYTVEQINDATYAMMTANNIVDGYIRPIVWRGSEQMGVLATHTKTNVAIAAWLWPSYYTVEARLKGIRMNISQWKRPSAETAPVKAKAAGLYMICTLSKNLAESAGFEDSLFFDYRGRVAEATGANIFFVIDGEIHTPIPDCILDGITRRTVIDLARTNGYKVIERAIMPEDMGKAQECFITGTAAEVTPVREIGDYKFTPGDVCRKLMTEYDALVRRAPAAKSSAA